MDRLDELDVLVAIVDTGSLAGAARRLKRSPPAVTRMLAGLEARLGIRLVERTTRRLAPTDAGLVLVEQARRILADYDGAVSIAADAPLRGTLRITAPVVFGRRHVTPVVLSFLAAHPGIDVDLMLHDRNLDLIEERLHAAVRIGLLESTGLVVRKVGVVRRVLVAAPEYLESHGVPAHPTDLASHQIVMSGAVSFSADWSFGDGPRTVGVRVSPRIRFNEVEAALQAARAGFGITRALSYQVRDDVAAGRLVRILAAHEPAPLPVHIVLPSGRVLASKVRAFVDHAVESFGRLGALHE